MTKQELLNKKFIDTGKRIIKEENEEIKMVSELKILLKKYIECQAIQDVIDNIEQHVENKPIKRNWEYELENLLEVKEFKGTVVEIIWQHGLNIFTEVEIEIWYQDKFEEVKNLELGKLKDIYIVTINKLGGKK